MTGYYRFAILIDIKADNLEDAYKELCAALKQQPNGWESTEEAYSPDGELIDPDIVNEVGTV